MWTVDASVEKSARSFVDPSYPRKYEISGKVIKSFYPQLLFSVYSSLEDKLGFPRPYYYY
jgi:hypothetical protein